MEHDTGVKEEQVDITVPYTLWRTSLRLRETERLIKAYYGKLCGRAELLELYSTVY